MALQKKPPVVTIMGHVDHGKTTLLDFIRKTKLAAKEVGEITQSIGAYRISVNNQKITFIDTPGHEAFSKMRCRGAKIADLVILVVAANDGVMQQTKESIKIIQEANVPFIVAINKIDLPGVSVEQIKNQLSEAQVFVEGYGGSVVAVPISAKTGAGVDQLLEMILLTAELQDLKADPQGDFEAYVIESKADKFCGSLVDLVVQNGSIKKGDEIQIDGITAKVKMLRDEWGKVKETALPSDPVQVLGFSCLPKVGSKATAAGSVQSLSLEKEASVEKSSEENKKTLKIILKADVSGSLEAIFGCLPKEIEVVEKSSGEISQSDIMLAKTLGAEIYGFNVQTPAQVVKLAETEKVSVKSYRIIYDLLKDLEERLKTPPKDQKNYTVLGRAEILAIFEMKGEKIAGGRVIEGKINKNSTVIVERGGIELGRAKIVSLKEQKQDINSVVAPSEFGAILSGKLDFKEGDVLISVILE